MLQVAGFGLLCNLAGLIMSLLGFVNNIGCIFICIAGGVFVAHGRITIGDVQAFIQYSKQFAQPVLQTANIANIIQSAVASAERVLELLDEEEMAEDEKVDAMVKEEAYR